MRDINTVTFDLWQTLILDSPELGRPRAQLRLRAALDTLGAEGYRFTMDDLSAAYQRCFKTCDAIRAGEGDVTFDEQVDIFLREIDAGLTSGLSSGGRARIAERYSNCYLDHPPRIDEGAHRVLDAVKRLGWKVGLICNTGSTPGAMQRIFLDQAGLGRFFDTLVFSDEERLSKPAARIFQVALDRLGASAESAVHIGDHPVNDVLGAKRAGLRAIWLRRGSQAVPAIPPDATIDTLEEAIEALSGLSAPLTPRGPKQ